MTSALLSNLLFVGATVAFTLGAVRIMHMFRGRAMRACAARWSLQYIGPPAPPRWWLNPAHFKTHPPLPGWIGHFHPSGQRIRQAWNVLQGQKDGISIIIFDTIIGEYKGGQPCTLILCQTGENPFRAVSASERIVQSHGWTVLHGSWLLWFSWMMRTKRIDGHIEGLQFARQTLPEHSLIET